MNNQQAAQYARSRLALALLMGDEREAANWQKALEYWARQIEAEGKE